ncbi:hypothetical protein [Rhizobium laguerreae]|uniref:hypothetical protein n=1 Tax=Rhizobium laguerreae TaxID=1076926 RepID=UPI0021B0D8CD|nr:hypothetical protein [Rhizobium laguerreae]
MAGCYIGMYEIARSGNHLKQIIGAVTGLLISCSAAIAQEPALHPKLTKEQFLSFSAGAVVAGMYCGKLELNADFFAGYQYGTGIYPPLNPDFGSEMARLEKEAKSDLKSYCSTARLMFYKGNKPKPLVAPLLIDKP